MSAILKQQKLITWTIVTSIAWMIAASIQFKSDPTLFSITQLISSPQSIVIVGLMQTILIWNHQQLRSKFVKMLTIQLVAAIVLQIVIFITGFFVALLSISTLGKSGIWFNFSNASAIVLWAFGMISHGMIQSWGLRQAWCDHTPSEYPHCPIA
jgi:hypothetical protein